MRAAIGAKHPDRRVETRALDVTDYAAVETVVADVAQALGGLDIVVANAGIGSTVPVGEGNFEGDRALIETNVIGAMATIDAAVALFKRQGRGQVVVISSVAAFRGRAGAASYGASKAAIGVYADAVRMELRDSPIKVTALYPGFIDTPLNRHRDNRPFLIDSAKGAAIIADLIERQVRNKTVPVWPWNVIGRAMRVLPDSVVARMG